MNVREILKEIPKRYPSAILTTKFDYPPIWYFLVNFETGWSVGAGYGYTHYSNTRLYEYADPTEATLVEVAIFDSKGDWYIPESSVVSAGNVTGVLPFQDSDQLFQILDYISKKEAPP